MRLLPAVHAALLSALVSVPFAATPPPAAAQSADGVNPCDFSGADAACQLADGVYRAWKPLGEGPFPAVVYLYGSLGEADLNYRSEFFRETITGSGHVLIVPEALSVVQYVGGITGTGWNRSGRIGDHPRDDVAFLRQVLIHAEQYFRIDRDRVIFVGQSDGGFMIWDLACHHPEMAAAYAVHAGSYGGALPERCDRPVRFLQTHGRQDTVVPFEAERIREGVGLTAANPVEGLDLLARTSGCAPREAAETRQLLDFQQTAWTGCAKDGAIEYWVHDGGHGYPGSWLPTVVRWFEQFKPEPVAVGQRVIRKPGDGAQTRSAPGAGGQRFKPGTRSAGRFKAVPK
ncbi:MAG: hypothetical protein AAF899_13220 [Pseudomonadota bacterium]